MIHKPPNNGMKLTRVGAGARRTGRSEALSWIAAQLMPGVRWTFRRNRRPAFRCQR